MSATKTTDLLPEVQRIVGDGYEVYVTPLTKRLNVKKDGVLLFGIFVSSTEPGYGFATKVDHKNGLDLAKKVSEELKIPLRE